MREEEGGGKVGGRKGGRGRGKEGGRVSEGGSDGEKFTYFPGARDC